MEKYPACKDSGIKWIGEIPVNWEDMKLKHFCTCNDSSLTEKEDENLQIEYVEIGDVDLVNGINNTQFYKFAETPSRARRITHKDDVIISTVRTYLKAIAHVDRDGLIVSTGFAVLRPKNINSKFMSFALTESHFIDSIISMSLGVNYPAITPTKLLSIKLPIPPLPEQQSIVTFLEKETANIDAYIKQREQEINTLNELKQAEIAEVVTKGINPDAPMKDSGIPWVGQIPEHWECKRIGSTYVENKNINSDLGCSDAYKFNYGSLVRKDEDVKLEEVADVYSKYTVISKNDIIINGLNLNYDFVTQRVAIVEQKGIITSAYVAITPREDVNSEYFSYLFKSMDAKKLFNGMGTGIRLTLGFGELKKQQIPIPPKDEQDLIVKNIKAKTSKIEEYITALKSEIAQMQEYKQRLISDVVTGKMKV